MDMKISKRDAALLIALAGILLAVCAYKFIYMSYMEKADAIEAESQVLQERVNHLQEMANQKEFYLTEIERFHTEIETSFKPFPADVRDEDIIMMVVNMQNTSPWEAVSTVSLGGAEERYVMGQAAAEAAAAEAATAAATAPTATTDTAATDVATTDPAAVTATEATVAPAVPVASEPAKILYTRPAGISYQTDYNGFLTGLAQVLTSTDRRTIDKVTATYDSNTGILAVATTINMYYLTGTDKEYVAPSIPYVMQGTDNIFGTISLVNEDGEEDTDAEEADED